MSGTRENPRRAAGIGVVCPESAGFTLIEIVMVIAVAAVAIGPLMSLFTDATSKSVKPVLATQALFLAQEKMEEIIADYHASGRGYGYIISANYPDEVSPDGFTGFTVAVSVSADSSYQNTTFKQVEVRVSNSGIDDVVLTSWVTN